MLFLSQGREAALCPTLIKLQSKYPKRKTYVDMRIRMKIWMKETYQSPPDGIPFFIDDDIIIRIRIPWPCVNIPDNVQLGQSRFLFCLILESVSHLNNIKPSLFELNLHQWQNNLRNSFISIICGTSSSPACIPIPHYQFQFDYYLMTIFYIVLSPPHSAIDWWWVDMVVW